MTFAFRFSILSAVSTKAQAKKDKSSLEDQITACRHVIERGWRETAGPYIVPGQSRTKYLNLRDAEAEIPAIHDMLEAARRGEYDVLVVYDHDRLRDLLKLVYAALSDYGVQLFSWSLQNEPVPPDEYDPYDNDTNEMLIGLSDMRSKMELARMRRKYRIGMRNRVLQGLPVQLPYGYRKPLQDPHNRKAVPEQDPLIVPHLIRIKDMLLAGRSIRQLIDYLTGQALLPPRGAAWYPQTVRDMLKNPFYSGWVRFEATKVVKDRRSNTRSRDRHISPDKVIQARGLHTPLWDDATRQAMLIEIRRRAKNYRGRQNNQFTGLLSCGVCSAPLWRNHNGPRSLPDRLIWRCSRVPSHTAISHVDLLAKFGDLLALSLQGHLVRMQANIIPADRAGQSALDLNELRRQRKRLEDGYLRGLFSLDTFEQRLVEIDKQIKANQDTATRAELSLAVRESFMTRLRATLGEKPSNLPAWLRKTDPAEVNHLLHYLLETIIVTDTPTGPDLQVRYKPG